MKKTNIEGLSILPRLTRGILSLRWEVDNGRLPPPPVNTTWWNCYVVLSHEGRISRGARCENVRCKKYSERDTLFYSHIFQMR